MDHVSRVTTYRESRGLTIRDLSGLSGVTPRTIDRIERGDSLPKPNTRRAIARALKVAPSLLWPGVGASIRERRVALGLSQEGLATRAEIAASSLRTLEHDCAVSEALKTRVLTTLSALEVSESLEQAS